MYGICLRRCEVVEEDVVLSGSRVYIFYGLRRGGVIIKKLISRRMRDDGGVVFVRESVCV